MIYQELLGHRPGEYPLWKGGLQMTGGSGNAEGQEVGRV
jgi:hypothetical protein